MLGITQVDLMALAAQVELKGEPLPVWGQAGLDRKLIAVDT